MSSETRGSHHERRAATARALHLDLLAARLLVALEEAGVDAVLLKGAAVASWLYDDGEARPYGDVDVLVPVAQLARAREVVRTVAPPGLVDLHETIGGVGTHPAEAFPILRARTGQQVLAGHTVRTLDEVARTLHVVLHAAWHGPGDVKPLRDLEKALTKVDDATWREAAALAQRLRATPSFVTGLGLLPAGRALRDRLGLRPETTTRARLGFGTASATAQRLADVELACGWRAKRRAVRRTVAPPSAELAERYPGAGLLRAHLRRVSNRIGEVPAAVRAWRAERRRGT